ncbi:MAG: dienelactone hydrolase family protein [Acidobacteriota bacterium]|nr:dienelactone hydrolase family protein [Acidobacteriota bacterium]
MTFRDRIDAGRQLAPHVAALGLRRPVVLGMARGGVPVAGEVARALGAPLDVLVVRKLGHPDQPELALGAIAEGGARVLNTQLVEQLGISPEALEAVAVREGAELDRRLAAYRDGRDAVDLAGRDVVVVDDGLATGATARVAVATVTHRGAARVVLAVPVAPPSAVRALQAEADDVVCVEVSDRFFGISQWYEDFRQVGDDEVREALGTAHRSVATAVEVPVGGGSGRAEVVLPGDLVVPPAVRGVVVFAHGSGSSRRSPRNVEVAGVLQRAGFATLLFDLLTETEAGVRANIFDVSMLGDRLTAATEWTADQPALAGLPVGLFGASTGAGASLVTAARLGRAVAVVVSRGGRPDLAPEADLATVLAPTLLVVGGADTTVLELNREAMGKMTCRVVLEVVPGAGHLFEEPGALEEVARLAQGWFAAAMPNP